MSKLKKNTTKKFAPTKKFIVDENEKALLKLHFRVASLRKAPDNEIVKYFMKAFEENKLHALKWLFFARDIHSGLGERRLFRVIARHLFTNHRQAIVNLIGFFPVYGRWDDIFALIGCPNDGIVFDTIKSQLDADLADMYEQKPISLLAKWLPSINASSKTTIEMAHKIRKHLKLSQKEYRQILSQLRSYIQVTETFMSANRWHKIDYHAVPFRASMIYQTRFLKNDKIRRLAYFISVRKNKAKNKENLHLGYTVNPATILTPDNENSYEILMHQLLSKRYERILI
ncbi:MAG: DUF2828 domain-containing protein [Firmicutes bacterium]|nr:DUF2828 domain-containing protein [Bacillota bacterium]